MSAWRDLNRAILQRYRDQAEAYSEYIDWQLEVGCFRKQRTLVVGVGNLILGTSQWHIATPLVGDYAIVHCATNYTEHLGVKEEFRTKARWLERHWQKVAVRTAVGLVGMGVEILE
jgi:hypothetical protein